MRFFGVPPRRRILLLLLVGVGLVAWTWQFSPHRWRLNPRVTDEIGLLPELSRVRHEEMLQALFDESGVDLRLLLVANTGEEPIERFAVRRARELGTGQKAGGRGLLVVYDSSRHELRIEVGPPLQGILPDGFVGFVVREHARAFFEGGDPELGLRLAVRILHWRIRDAQLGGEYDPSFEEYVSDVRRLATGGGASNLVGTPVTRRPLTRDQLQRGDSVRFAPQPTVAAAHERFLEWLALERHVASVPLFTPRSQQYLAGLPLTRAYKAGWLAMEYGKAYAVDQRGDLALLYFTGTPLVSPHFFRHTGAGWQLDLQGELVNTSETIGGWYSWILLDSGDEYSRVFVDRWMPFDDAGFGTYYRVAGGDNRRLITRAGADEATALDRLSADAASIEGLTVFEAAARIKAVDQRPSVVVLYRIDRSDLRQEFEGLVRLAEFCASHGIELLAFDTSDTQRNLAEFLATSGAPFPAAHIYQWRPGLLDSTFGALGIEVGRSWAAPLVAVRDRTGRVVAQGQRVTDWAAVIAEARATLGS
jgi:uncharacterized protein